MSRRADRLFQIIQTLRGGRLVRARDLAERLEVSERTIYRDISDLISSGVPIDGAAGVGYLLREGFDLPPLMFTRSEMEALALGARMVQAWASADLGEAAAEALVKIAAVLPDTDRSRMEQTRLYAPDCVQTPEDRGRLAVLKAAIDGRTVLTIGYQRPNAEPETRPIWPLGLFFWGRVWSLAAWCELRQDFRTFRVDRILSTNDAERRYPHQRGRTLADYLVIQRSTESAATAPASVS